MYSFEMDPLLDFFMGYQGRAPVKAVVESSAIREVQIETTEILSYFSQNGQGQ